MLKDHLKKTDWSARMGNEVPENEPVDLWVYPHGCVCNVSRVDGVSMIQNGHYTAVNTVLGKLLLEAGIEGEFILYSTEVIPQNTSRWLTWWLSTQPEDDDPLLSTIQITTFGVVPKKTLPFQVSTIRPQTMRAKDIIPTVIVKSRDTRVSIFVARRRNGEKYELEPTRKVEGQILSYTDYGFVVKTTPDNSIILVPRVSRKLLDNLARRGVTPRDLCGQKVTVQYTMKTEGLRLGSYKSPLLLKAVSLEAVEELDSADIDPYEKELPFVTSASLKSGSLTPTRCGRAAVRMTETGIEGYETGTETVLYRLTPGVQEGRYAAVMSKGAGDELWTFSSDFAVDSLNPRAFVRSVAEAVFENTGYAIDRLGLYYSTPEGAYIGFQPLASLAA